MWTSAPTLWVVLYSRNFIFIPLPYTCSAVIILHNLESKAWLFLSTHGGSFHFAMLVEVTPRAYIDLIKGSIGMDDSGVQDRSPYPNLPLLFKFIYTLLPKISKYIAKASGHHIIILKSSSYIKNRYN